MYSDVDFYLDIYIYIDRFCFHIHLSPLSIYVTVFAKKDHLGANFDFEFCIWSECALLPLYNALYYALVADSVSEICLRKVWNYEKCVVEKTTFKHLLLVKPQHSVLFRITEYPVSVMIINLGWPSSLATCRFTGLSEGPPEVIVIDADYSYGAARTEGQRLDARSLA